MTSGQCPACGHAQVEGAFCGACGLPLARAVPQVAAISEIVPAGTPAQARNYKKIAIVSVAGLVMLGLAVGAAAIWAPRGGKADQTASSHSAALPAASVESAHDICTSQLIATATDLHDNTNSGYTNEVGVNGGSDPFISAGYTISGQFTSDYYAVGANAAVEKMTTNAGNYCSSSLNDAQRGNFPTDGTYPGQGDAQSGGSDNGATEDQGTGCANDETPQSDQQGNLVCPNG
jgi:hypothetical protein